jgi:hypothetical protein
MTKLTKPQQLILDKINVGSQITTSYIKGSSTISLATLESLKKKGIITYDCINCISYSRKTYLITSINK